MTKGRHGLTNEQIYALAEAQGFICPLSKIALEVREGEIYDPTTGKRKKILEDAGNFVLLGRTYIETLGDVFDGDYLTLIPGEEIRNDALKLMSERMQKNNRSR